MGAPEDELASGQDPNLSAARRPEVVIRNIALLAVDAIVNAANTSLLGGRGAAAGADPRRPLALSRPRPEPSPCRPC